MYRHPLLWFGILAIAGGLGWSWLHPSALHLRLDPQCREVALLYPKEANGRRTAGAILQALAELAPPEHRASLRTQLVSPAVTAAESVAIGFAPMRPAECVLGAPKAEGAGKIIPGIARIQLQGVPHGYLLVQAAPAASLLETAGRRRWLGRALIAASGAAESATIAVGESDDGAWLVATIAFAYRTGAEAEAAFQQLMAKQGDYDALGFAARPGTGRITRQTQLLVVRFDIETDLVLQALRSR